MLKVIYVKRKTVYSIITIIVLLISLLVFFYREKISPTFSLPVTDKIIVIDPGHGGVDPGTVGESGTLESKINLELSLKLKSLLEQSGAIVIMTRSDNKGLYTSKSNTLREKKIEDLKNRRKIVEDSEAEIFISIHMNSFTSSKYYGAQTFFNEGSIEGEKLANTIQVEFRERLDNDNLRTPTARDNIYVLKELNIPAVLVEAGFLSNPLEEKLLKNKKHQEKVAWSIFSGLIKYIEEKE
ncbi:N-acetylmuramoyl-L-alanine amidase CwlD [Tissierella creatinophila]|uniref:Germination-specific N-acetylmuramoyl-L-alanine amidase n=1 Tax=Tissierella creatinophila DSM 6911 TaxID=1123403 RepID=A0A1U7M4I7_TISCR|nr:N-acetylmuramoyl-L-alanine amidase CwlD [Tissierella creatinophila]OLS02108.1 germination-specific N-acetylmuramoyl-L-alanine amidase precursor [Tissierella creatinophila DSM 6911]